jgi:hypothetical protein
MKSIVFILGLLFIAGCALNGGVSPTISAVDVDGTWNVVSTEGICGIVASAFEFKADGNTLTGAVRSPVRSFDLKGVKIRGDEISFTVMTFFYKGIVKDDEINLSCRSMPAPGPVPGTSIYSGVRSRLTLKRE